MASIVVLSRDPRAAELDLHLHKALKEVLLDGTAAVLDGDGYRLEKITGDRVAITRITREKNPFIGEALQGRLESIVEATGGYVLQVDPDQRLPSTVVLAHFSELRSPPLPEILNRAWDIVKQQSSQLSPSVRRLIRRGATPFTVPL